MVNVPGNILNLLHLLFGCSYLVVLFLTKNAGHFGYANMKLPGDLANVRLLQQSSGSEWLNINLLKALAHIFVKWAMIDTQQLAGKANPVSTFEIYI